MWTRRIIAFSKRGTLFTVSKSPRKRSDNVRTYRIKVNTTYNPSDWPRKSLSERYHEIVSLFLLLECLLARVIHSLPLAESSPCKLDHFLIPMSNEPYPIKHF